jgi:hypothetical protein
MAIKFVGGKILFVSGAIAMADACCCNKWYCLTVRDGPDACNDDWIVEENQCWELPAAPSVGDCLEGMYKVVAVLGGPYDTVDECSEICAGTECLWKIVATYNCNTSSFSYTKTLVRCGNPAGLTLDTWTYLGSSVTDCEFDPNAGYPVCTWELYTMTAQSCYGSGDCSTEPSTPSAPTGCDCDVYFCCRERLWQSGETCLNYDPENPDIVRDMCRSLGGVLAWGGFGTCYEEGAGVITLECLGGPWSTKAECQAASGCS